MKLFCVAPAFFGSGEFYCVAKSKREAKRKYFEQHEQRSKWVNVVKVREIIVEGYVLVEDITNGSDCFV